MNFMNPSSPAISTSEKKQLPRVICFANDVYNESMAGGDVYFYFMARAAIDAGHPIHFIGGHAFKKYVERWKLPANITLTDAGQADLGDVTGLPGQLRLLWDFMRRFFGTLKRLKEVKPDDIAYVMSDFWFDAFPLVLCRAKRKILYVGMLAPSFKQILFKQRGDITSTRLSSIYFWLSQQLSVRWFRYCRNGIVTYSHPEMRIWLDRVGYPDSRLRYVPNGSDTVTADRVPPQTKVYDLAWTGRVHPQKGIDDLLEALAWLKTQLPDFRAVIIGKSKDKLESVVHQMGLAGNVTFSGLVSEEEKFRLLKSSRIFLMPSHYESWGIVVGEALVSGTPVVAYRLSCYPPVFGDAVRYARPFNVTELKQLALDEIRRQREGKNYLAEMNEPELRHRLSWTRAQESFSELLAQLAARRENR